MARTEMVKTLRSVVVAGIGLVSPVGIGTEQTWLAIQNGVSGIALITLFPTDGFSCRFSGEIKDFSPEEFVERKDVKKTGRFIHLAMAAAQCAMEEARLRITEENAGHVGVYIGSGIGAFEVIERAHQADDARASGSPPSSSRPLSPTLRPARFLSVMEQRDRI